MVPRAPRRLARGAARRPHRADPRTRLPHRRYDPGPPGHRGRLPHRAWLHHPARGGQRRGDPGAPVPRGHRASLPGQPRQPGRQDRPTGARRPGDRHRRHPRRDLRAHRPETRHCPQARRRGQGGPQQPLQAHPAPGQLPGQHARPGRRGTAHAEPGRVRAPLGQPSDRRHRAPLALPPAQGRGAPPHPRGPAQGDRRPRCRHRSHQALTHHRRGPHRPHGSAGRRRGPSRGDPLPPAAPSGRPGAPQDPGGVRGAARPGQGPARDHRLPGAPAGHRLRRARRDR